MEKRKTRSLARRSSILKIDLNREEDTGILGKGPKSSRRVSFAETYQVKEFPRDSPQVWRRGSTDDDDEDEETNEKSVCQNGVEQFMSTESNLITNRASNGAAGNQVTITGLDKLLTGTIQSQVYENITECPIPEMSSDSLNMSKLFDVNRTVLGPVDMDTTDMVENNNIELPFMDTGQDYSSDFKFDASSFLSNLRGKPSDRLKTIQIYSPSQAYSNAKENFGKASSTETKRDRSPLKSLSIEQQSANMANMVSPDKSLHLFEDIEMSTEPEHKIDAKSFLTNLIGPKQKTASVNSIFPSCNNGETVDHDTLDMDDENMDETTCYGGIVDKDAVKELTNQISAKMEDQASQSMDTESAIRHTVENIKVSDRLERDSNSEYVKVNAQHVEVPANETMAMEQTKCYGGILNKPDPAGGLTTQADIVEHNIASVDQTFIMEETKTLGGIMNKSLTKELHNQGQKDQIRCNETFAMEETKCHGGILNKTNITKETYSSNLSLSNEPFEMEETKCLTGLIHKNTTKELASEMQTDETKVYQNLNMEETRCHGGILNKSNFTKDITENKLSPSNQIHEMEETKCLTGLINRNITRELTSPLQADKTRLDQNLDMEETKCQGGILSRSGVSKDLRKEDLLESQTGNRTYFSDETCLTEDKKKNDTTLPILSLEKETCEVVGENVEREMNVKQIAPEITFNDIRGNETVTIEETSCEVVLINKADSTRELNNQTNSITKNVKSNLNSADTMSGMEETKCIGGIMNEDNITKVTENAELEKTTVYQSNDVEETKCQGGILDRSSFAKESFYNLSSTHQTVEMEETKCLTGLIKRNTQDINSLTQVNELAANQTVTMEETRCVGGMINRNTSVETNNLVAPPETTMNQTIMMEETKCVGGTNIVETKEVDADGSKERTINQTLSMEITSCVKEIVTGAKEGTDTTHSATSEDDKSIHECLTEDKLDSNTKRAVQEQPDADSDTEITFKKSSRETGSNFADEFTKETTQTYTKLQKLKEMLILSKKKTPTHLKRPAEPKMEVKSDQGLSLDSSSVHAANIGSPAHKKKKLFNTASDDYNSGIGGFGIEDEQMPDFMKTDDLLSETALTSNDTHSSSACNDSVKTRLSSTALKFNSSCVDGQDPEMETDHLLSASVFLSISKTVQHDELDGDLESDPLSSTAVTLNASSDDEKIQDSRKDRLPSTTLTLNSDDTSSSGSKDISLYQKQSLLSFTTDSCLSFIIPRGHVTLDMFKKAMSMQPCVLVKNSGRRSSFMAPRVNTEDMGEVMLAELTLDPLVKATKAAYEDVKERTRRNEETATYLREALEETQPQIFQDCVDLDGQEILALRTKVQGLHRTCHKLKRLYWTSRTKEATSQALRVVQDEGLSAVNSILDEIRSNKERAERFVQSIDDDLEEFLKTTQQLEELEQKKELLQRDMETVLLQVEEKGKDVSERIAKQEQEQNIQEFTEDIKQQIKLHLFLQEWDLFSLADNCAVFTFLDGELELRITFTQITEKSCIKSVDIQSHLNPGCNKISKRLAHTMALAGISTEKFKKYTMLDHLPQLLNEVSQTISEIRHFCSDLHWLSLSQDIKVDHRRIICDFWSLKTLDEITVQLDFNPSCPLSSVAGVDVQVIMGCVSPEKVKEDLQAVKPGKNYLSRLFSAVTFS